MPKESMFQRKGAAGFWVKILVVCIVAKLAIALVTKTPAPEELIVTNGEVQDIQVRESAGEIFDQAVIATVRDWRYEPATKDGVPVKMPWVQRFRFRQGR